MYVCVLQAGRGHSARFTRALRHRQHTELASDSFHPQTRHVKLNNDSLEIPACLCTDVVSSAICYLKTGRKIYVPKKIHNTGKTAE